jgi:membrane protease YdiL (CAAX protease family)
MLIGLVLPVIFILAALVTGALIGTYPADFAGAGGLVAIIEAQGVSLDGIPVAVLVASQFVGVLIGAFLNILPALGEEAGWRGWLVPRLLPRGPVVMIIVSGVLWGVWHAPLVLLGYNYPETPGWIAILSMTGMCTLVGAVFAWLRLRSDSVWPAALAHGSFNAAAGLSAVFAVAGSAVDPSSATILGWSGWIVPAGVVIVLLLTGAFRRPTAVPASDR